MKRLAVAIATVAGGGYSPVAPGTVGSAVGVLVYWLTRGWPLVWQWALIGGVVLVGTWAADVTAAWLGKKDPGEVVIDEVAGQLVTLIMTGADIRWIVIGFFLFRGLDIVKPPPARQFERLPGGVGIMADDIMAGVYGNLLLQVLMRVLPKL